jgi:guanylate kinase
VPDKKIIVIVGPSGSGKTSIGEILTANGIPRLTTSTTRPARNGEKDGVDYYFKDFDEMNPEDFVEQTVYNKKIYGLTKNEVTDMLNKYDIVHVSLDKSGAEAVKKAYPNETFTVFVSVTEDEMIERMRLRGDSPENIKARIKFSRATNELIPPEDADLIVRNVDVEKTAQQVIDAVRTMIHPIKKK